jgi:integrase
MSDNKQDRKADTKRNRKRRGRDEGSIFQRADGLWVASRSLGYDAQGKRVRKVAYGSTKREAQEALLKLLQSTSLGTPGDVDRLTVGQYLTKWLTVVKPTVEPNTFGPYERHVRLHLTPYLGGLKLAKLTPIHVKELYASLAAAGVSPALQRKVGTTLTIALGEAVEDGLIPFNPAVGVRKPKAAKPDIKVLDPDQVAAFLKAAETDRLFPFYLTALDSGARPGELFALLWADLDLEGRYLTVSKSLEEISGALRVKEVKTKKGRRRIDLSGQTVAALVEHRKRMLAEGFITGPVFCDTQGGYLRISNLRRDSFKPILSRAGLPDIRLYDLRHTSATLLLLADENPKVVSERLGHSSVTLTLDTYSHVLPTMGRRAADKLNAILGGGVPTAAEG